MIKVVYCISKKPGLTDEEFAEHWLGTHAGIAARIPGLRRLVFSRTTVSSGDFDGMVEYWFDDLAALQEARASSEWGEATHDERNFVDADNVAYFLTEEHVIST